MSTTGDRLPLRWRIPALLAVVVARPLSTLTPGRIRRILYFARRGVAAATFEQASNARQAIVTVSARCAGEACLQRSLATVLLCRMRGVWPTWCAGIRTEPFSAHAWVEVDGQLVGEPYPAGYHRPIMTVAHDGPAPAAPSEAA